MSKMKHKRNLGVPKASYAERLQQKAVAAEQKKKAWTHNVYVFTRQETIDLASIALHEAFGFGPERLYRFLEAYEKTFAEVMERTRADMEADDEDRWYSTAKLEEALKAAWGERYAPRSMRYDLDFAKTEESGQAAEEKADGD